jgi:hypothetical protein
MRKKTNIIIVCAITVIASTVVFFLFSRDDMQHNQSCQTARPTEPPTALPEQLPTTSMDTNKPFNPALLAEQLPPLPPSSGSVARARDKADDNNEPTSAQLEDMPEDLDYQDEEVVYLKAQVFRDEALETFPVYTVEIHKPESLESDNPGTKTFGPDKNEIWIRIKPQNAREMKEVMAQTADLYRQYVNEYEEGIKVIHWVGGQPWASTVYSPDGQPVTQ